MHRLLQAQHQAVVRVQVLPGGPVQDLLGRMEAEEEAERQFQRHQRSCPVPGRQMLMWDSADSQRGGIVSAQG